MIDFQKLDQALEDAGKQFQEQMLPIVQAANQFANAFATNMAKAASDLALSPAFQQLMTLYQTGNPSKARKARYRIMRLHSHGRYKSRKR